MWVRHEMEINGLNRKGHIVNDHFFVYKNNGWKVYHINSKNFVTGHFPTIKKKNEIVGFIEYLMNVGLNLNGKTVDEVFSEIDINEAYEKINEFFKKRI